MSEQRSKADVAALLMKTADGLTALADSVRALCGALDDGPRKEAKAKKQAIPLEKVRGVLAEKSRDGYTAEVRAIIQSFGAERLSEIDPADFEAVLKKAEALGNVKNRNYLGSTRSKVKAFQKAKGLSVDGKAEPKTIAALGGFYSAE